MNFKNFSVGKESSLRKEVFVNKDWDNILKTYDAVTPASNCQWFFFSLSKNCMNGTS